MVIVTVHTEQVDVYVYICRSYTESWLIVVVPSVGVIGERTVAVIIVILEDNENLWSQNSFQSVESVVIPTVRIHSVIVVPNIIGIKLTVEIHNHFHLHSGKLILHEEPLPVNHTDAPSIIVIITSVIVVGIIIVRILIVIIFREVI